MTQDLPLPANLDAERVVLGSILVDDSLFPEGVSVDHFSLDRHKRLWHRMVDLRARGDRIDYITLANELRARGQLESDTLAFITSLTDGMPRLPNVEGYVKILAEKAARRRIMFACQDLMNRAGLPSEDLASIVTAGQDLFSAPITGAQSYRSVDDLPSIADSSSVDIEYIRKPELPRGSVVGLTGGAGCGKSSLMSAWARDAWQNKGVPSLFLDRENPGGVIADRLKRLGTEEGPGLRFWGGWLPQEAPQPTSGIIRAWARECRGILVVDSLSAFLEGGDQNDASIVRTFLHGCRRLADLGACVVVIHHDGKAESSKDYRGSSDFAAAIDCGFHVANFGASGELGRILVRPYKCRMGAVSELAYDYAGGRFVRGDEHDAQQTASEQLTALLRMNPGITARRFDELVKQRSLGRDRARSFLADGVRSGAIRRETGSNNERRHYLALEAPCS